MESQKNTDHNYKIILDEEKLSDFIKNDLPDLGKNEIYYVSLFSRSKYATDQTVAKEIGDKSQLKRFTAYKDLIIPKIKQLETKIGAYTSKKGTPIPQETLAIYITINPRDTVKASKKALRDLLDNLDLSESKSPNVVGFNAVQVSPSTKRFFDWDFDVDKSKYTIEDMKRDLLDKTPLELDDVNILETRGGFHLLVKSKEYKDAKRKWYPAVEKWFKATSEDTNVELDKLLPIPYCTQGGFMPTYYKF